MSWRFLLLLQGFLIVLHNIASVCGRHACCGVGRDFKATIETLERVCYEGAAKQILWMRISRDRSAGKLRLSQAEYIGRVLKRFRMEGAKAVSTPLGNHFKLSKEEASSVSFKQHSFSRVFD